MPTAKRLRSGRQPQTEASSSRSTTEPGDRDSEFAHLARQHWLKSSKRAVKVKVKNDVLKKEIWGSLERENFQHKSLLALESLQLLER